MSSTPSTLGRRERNKLAKLERITAAAAELFAEHGVDDVTTQQIADKADIGTGTLFLYAKTKGELLLMVQNAHYAESLDRGEAAAEREASALEALLALLTPIVECNRVQVDNGRTYLREMAFGDPTEPHHAEALAIVGRTEAAAARLLGRRTRLGATEAAALARVISAVVFVTMASSTEREVGVIVEALRDQLAAILPR